MSWPDTASRLLKAYADSVMAATIYQETRLRVERLQGILLKHNRLWDAATNTALEAKTAADNELFAAAEYADSNFRGHGFSVEVGGAHGMIEFDPVERDKKVNSYLRGQAEGELSESELFEMNDQLA